MVKLRQEATRLNREYDRIVSDKSADWAARAQRVVDRSGEVAQRLSDELDRSRAAWNADLRQARRDEDAFMRRTLGAGR